MTQTIDSAARAERQRLQAQIRSLGLAEGANLSWPGRDAEAVAVEERVLVDDISPLEVRNVLVPLRDVEFRDASGTGDGSFTLTGYAAVYGQETVLYDSNWWRFREVIAPGAFDAVLETNPDVHLNSFLHDFSRPVARTGIDGIGGLELASDSEGLRVFARLNPQDPDVLALAQKMPIGIVDQMSFMFTIASATYTSDVDEENDFEDELRTINQIGELYDVLVCAQGAYPQTSAELALRSRMNAALQRRDSESGANPVEPPADDDTEPEVEAPEASDAGEETVDAPEAGGEERATQKARATAMRMRIALDD